MNASRYIPVNNSNYSKIKDILTYGHRDHVFMNEVDTESVLLPTFYIYDQMYHSGHNNAEKYKLSYSLGRVYTVEVLVSSKSDFHVSDCT